MATKMEERKALEQIKKIIAGLGEYSYIATAMDGMIEDAEENIENDFAMSWRDRAQTYEKKLEELAKLYDHDTCEANKKQELLEKELTLAKRTIQQENERAHKFMDERDDYCRTLKETQNEVDKLQKENDRLMDEVKVLKADYEDEIIRLKAKLYDMMVK